ncbi:MAG: DUF58 domain-containing protein [Chloroflexi bacterium]|nr:DUF58 domain-containing protein [Chloroflexota bacterium]
MKPGRILVALMFILGLIGALVSGAAIYSRFLYSSVLLLAAAWLWTHWVVRGLAVERTARGLRGNVGDVFEENFKLTNHGRLPLASVEVLNQSSLPLAAGSRLFTLLMGKQNRIYTARTWLTQRGGFQLGPTQLTTGDPFGLFTASRAFPARQTLIVFPKIYEIQSFPSLQCMLTGGQVIRKRSPDMTPHASGVREYIHGDAMKRIHWPTTVRRHRMMVKEFEQDPQAEIWIYLDAQKVVQHQQAYKQQEVPAQDLLLSKRPKIDLPPSTLEYSVSIAASLAHFFIRQRRAVGFTSAGQALTVLRAERSERQESKILETLAFVKADGNLSIAGLVSTQASLLPQGSSVILITPTMRPDLLHAVDDLLLHYLSPIVVLLNARSFGAPAETHDILNALKMRRILVIPIKCGDDLSQALSGISTHFHSQEIHTWQIPELSPLT